MSAKTPAIVAFLDLLGFSQRLRDTWDQPDSALEQLLAIKDRANAENGMMTVTIQGHDQHWSRPDLVTVSDSLVYRAPLRDISLPAVSTASAAIFGLIGRVIELCAINCFGLRGGVELGQAHISATETIGPAFLDAYELEGIAETVRVLVGPALLERLAEIGPAHHHLGEQLYRCSDLTFAVRPSFSARSHLQAVRREAPPKLQYRFAEVVSECREANSNVSPVALTRAAAATRQLIVRKREAKRECQGSR